MGDTNRSRWEDFIQNHDGAQIAAQLRHDQELCKARRLPSLLALYMPPPDSDLAGSVSLQLQPESVFFPRSIRNLQYSGVINGIKAHLEQMSHTSTSLGADLHSVPSHRIPKPTEEQLSTALTVVEFLLENSDFPDIRQRGSIKSLIDALNVKVKPDSQLHHREALAEDCSRARKRRNCYICQMTLFECHPEYSSLCKACGRFNLAESSLSLPENLSLKGKTALVTGGRLNLGYHTALRLLRCGVKVIISTRYPRDAESRYLAETDSPEWCRRLKIFGADFRAAKDVFQLVAVVKEQLGRWAVLQNENRETKLDILINNAAQTLTDPIEIEQKAIAYEAQLQLTTKISSLFDNSHSYQARVRGGMESVGLLSSSPSQPTQLIMPSISEDIQETKSSIDSRDSVKPDNPQGSVSTDKEIDVFSQPVPKTSWMQSLHEIPYEDVVSAHSVNTLVPLILIRELLPLMGSTSHSSRSSSERKSALAHIINVSSREGIFESSSSSSSKGGHHVHTNMSKAGLNMITQTEAERCWRERKVAMNSVDPGYMSAAPEIVAKWERGSQIECPIGWEDGAGRVLWPIAVSHRGDEAVWGRFLKHFGAVEVSVGVGR